MNAKKAAIIVACALFLIIFLFSCDDYFLDPPKIDVPEIEGLDPEDFAVEGTPTISPSPSSIPPPPPVDHVAAFKKHVMVDRAREPDWLARVTHVRLIDGTLSAETTFPADWRDTSTPSRPAESICGQLFSYAQRGAKLTWTTITVKASDGTALVTRQGVGGSCKQI